MNSPGTWFMVSISQLSRSASYLIFILALVGVFWATGQAQDVSSDNKPEALESVKIEITTHLGNQQHFAEQDVISFLISLDRAAFVYVFYQDASGHVYQLMPGKAQSRHYFEPGFYIPFPPENSAFQFVVQAPFGEEQLWVVASDQGQLQFKGRDTGQGVKQLSQKPLELLVSIKTASTALFGEARLIIYTHGR